VVSELTVQFGPTARLGHVDTRLVRHGAVGSLLGGLVLFVVMAIYNAATGMGFWSILNACFAAFAFSSATMMPEPMTGHGMAEPMMAEPIVASHLAVGAVLHVLMSAVVRDRVRARARVVASGGTAAPGPRLVMWWRGCSVARCCT
jgi:hypothetical protein